MTGITGVAALEFTPRVSRKFSHTFSE